MYIRRGLPCIADIADGAVTPLCVCGTDDDCDADRDCWRSVDAMRGAGLAGPAVAARSAAVAARGARCAPAPRDSAARWGEDAAIAAPARRRRCRAAVMP